MRFATIDSIAPASLPTEFPIQLQQHTSPASTVLKLLVMIPVTLALLTPFLLLAEAFAASPAARAVLHERPSSLIQLGFGLAFWVVLFAWPLKRLIDDLGRSRSVEIRDGQVTVTQKRLFGAKTWTTPLADYAGVIHHVRASLSGLRHELILAHAERRNSILLAIADRFTQNEIDHVAALLGQREVPSASIYTLRVRRAALAQATTGEPFAQAA